MHNETRQDNGRAENSKFKTNEEREFPFITPNNYHKLAETQENLQRTVKKPNQKNEKPRTVSPRRMTHVNPPIIPDGEKQDYHRSVEKSTKDTGYPTEGYVRKTDLKKILHFHLRNCVNPDILVKVGNNNVYCHRILLRSYTDFFENFEVMGDSCSVSIPEEKVTLKAFETVYNWMLLGGEDCFKLINRKNFLEVYMAAQHLEIKDLQALCKSILDSEDLYSEGNAFFLLMDANRFNNKEIMDMMLPRIQRFYLSLVSSKDFVYLPVDVLCNLLSSNYICVHSEMEVFMSAVRWLIHDWEERSKLSYEVMKNIRFGLMSPSQLVDIKRNPDSPEILRITCDQNIQRLIDDGMAFAVKVHCHDGDFDEVTVSCKKLGLTPPAMRNWAGTDKKYKKYQEFIKELDDIQKDSKSYAANFSPGVFK